MEGLQQSTDEQLAGAAQAGSLAAFEELVRRHEDRLFRFLCVKAPSVADAEDLAQQTFVTAWRRIAQFRCEARFNTWLYTIARRLTISHYRNHGRVTHCGLDDAAPELVQAETAVEIVSRAEEHQLVWRVARLNLKDEAFDVLWMKYREHMSVVEIATAMQRTEVSVKVMLHRARKVLAQKLETEAARPPSNSPLKQPFNPMYMKLSFVQGGRP